MGRPDREGTEPVMREHATTHIHSGPTPVSESAEALASRHVGYSIPRCRRRTSVGSAVLAAFAASTALTGVLASQSAGANVGGAAHGAAAAGAGRTEAVARAAHMLNVKDEGHLHQVSESGSNLVEEGPATGTVPGRVKVYFNIGPTVYSSFTIYANGGGSITGHGSGTLHSTGKWSTFGGAVTVNRGTGRYAHARGTGQMYGAINRKTYALTVQTIGKLTY
jgi:hypothetical protein